MERKRRREKEEKKKRKKRKMKKSTKEEQSDELKEETEGCVNKQPKGQKRVDTAQKRCGVKKERGREGLWDEKEVGALKGNGKEMR